MNAATLHDAAQSGPFVIVGPCVMESQELCLETAHMVAAVCANLGLTAVFKSSFDKANRTSIASFRGPGIEQGLKWLEKVKQQTGLPVLTDVHLPEQVGSVAAVADVIQIPAFLCRQTDLLVAAAQSNRVVNIKKGQFVAPWDMGNAVDKVRESGNDRVWLTERGSSFGYNNLVVDFRSIPAMQEFHVPVVFDATHSVQLPGGGGICSGGQREMVPVLARAAVAAGCDGVFLEVHPDPDKAKCDGPNSWRLERLEPLLKELKALWEARCAL